MLYLHSICGLTLQKSSSLERMIRSEHEKAREEGCQVLWQNLTIEDIHEYSMLASHIQSRSFHPQTNIWYGGNGQIELFA